MKNEHNKSKKGELIQQHIVESLCDKFKEDEMHMNRLFENDEVSSLIEKSIGFTIDEMRRIPYNIRCLLFEIENIDRKTNQNFFEAIEYDFVGIIIRHLRDVGAQKRESHSMGANFIVFSEKANIGRRSRDTLIENSCNINKEEEIVFSNVQRQHLYRAYRIVNPARSFFAFKKYKKSDKTIYKFEGVYDFIDAEKSLDVKMLSLCNDAETVGFSMEPDNNCIKVYHNYRCFFDYYINESSGDWRCRFRSELESFVRKFHDGNLGDALVSALIELSYSRCGSMIIITDSDPQFNDGDVYKELKTPLTVDLLKEQFLDFAKDDGAVIIRRHNSKNLVLDSIGVMINPKQNLDLRYEELIKNTHSGSRHEKAARHACENPNDYVFVISENKTISFLHGTEYIFWRDKQQVPQEDGE